MNITGIGQMNRLEGGEVVLIVGEPEPDVIGPEEVRVADQREFVGEVCAQLFRQDHVT